MFIIAELLIVTGILWLIINLFHYFLKLPGEKENPLFALSKMWQESDKNKSK